ncbi:putative basic amino acid antiporter YfcC [Tissierella sp. MSJ-40]|uniref:Basic amino acid antiporter YfcC n=2 Tax=Tissierella simiarum TaxID=2841534 RepID=A0ABS6E1X6_9FIRM|nr:putative basic amino acid antiporter YfcC [Tissierella simiarum]
MPDTYVIIFCVVVLAALLTYLVPLGRFEIFYNIYDGTGKEIASTLDGEAVEFNVNGVDYTLDASGDTTLIMENGVEEPIASIRKDRAKSFESINENGELNFKVLQEYGKYVSSGEKKGIKLFAKGGDMGFLNFAFEGLVKGDKWGTSVGIIAFILVVGGAFGIVLKTGAVEAGIMNMISKTKGTEALLIPMLFLLFSIGGAVFGMGEEAIPFTIIIVPIVIAMGYDAVVGILITYGATQIGFATSWMNPFSVSIAQSISGLPIQSGSGFRIIMYIVFNIISIAYIWFYAKNIRKNPTKSVAYESDSYFREDFKSNESSKLEFKFGHILIIIYLVLAMAWIIWGVRVHEYYLPEIATIFFALGLASGITAIIFKLNNMTVNDIAVSFREGAKDLVGAAIVVALAQGIVLVLGDSNPGANTVLNTILNGMSKALSRLPVVLSAWFMYIFQSVFNFFVVSGSGQAAITMPLMAPLAQLIGLSKQVAVLAFQLGDGLTNLIVPTSACLMAVLGVAKLDWVNWAKFQIKFQGLLFITASIFIVLGVLIGF